MKKNKILGWILIALAVILIAMMIIPTSDALWLVYDILLVICLGLGGILLVREK